MKHSYIFFYEAKHLLKKPFKVIALLLFISAGIYGLHNGADVFHSHNSEVVRIKENIQEDLQTYLDYYDAGERGPKDKPWINMTTPYWAIYNAGIYQFKAPSPAMVYSIGQAEQYGFYKKITVWSSPYDPDMIEEIANPERLQIGSLDFAFTTLFLLPLLFLVLVYDIKSTESERGFMPLIELQSSSKHGWLLSRVLFYSVLIFVVQIALMLYGSMLTPVFKNASDAFLSVLLYNAINIAFWTLLYFFVLRSATDITTTTLKLASVWLLLSFILPASVHQWVSLEKPTSLMTNIIDVKRDGTDKIYALTDSVFDQQLFALYPELKTSELAQAKDRRVFGARRFSRMALINVIMKEQVELIEEQNRSKNALVNASFIVNPVMFFKNKLNAISGTHYNDFANFRSEIQRLVDVQIGVLLHDLWNDAKIDKTAFQSYQERLYE